MNRSGKISIVLWLLSIVFAGSAPAMTVYLNDESEIEAQSAWRVGDRVHVRVNPQLVLEFPASEVNVARSGIRADAPAVIPIAGPAATAPARTGSIMDELIVANGVRRDFDDIFGRAGRGEIEQILADSFTPAQAERIFRRCLERRLSNRDLAVTLAWFKSPTGAKIVETNSVWDFNRTEKSFAYASMGSAPGFTERMKAAEQIVKISGSNALETRLVRDMMVKMMKSIPPDYPSASEIKQRIKEEMPTLEMTHKQSVQMTAYTYRDLSVNELRSYLNFMRSPAGNRYIKAVGVATEEILKKVTANIEKDFRRFVRR